MKKLVSLFMALGVAAALTACSGSQPAASGQADSKTAQTEGKAGQADSKDTKAGGNGKQENGKDAQVDGNGSQTEAKSADQLKVALCLTGPINDGAWNTSAYDGLMEAQKKYGFEAAYVENLAVTDQEAALTDYAEQGFDIVIGHSFQFTDPAMTVGAKYPDTKFVVIEGNATGDNVASYCLKSQENYYLLGVLGASLSESGKIGIVGTVEGQAIIKLIEGYRMGAKTVNPDIQIQYAYIGSFTDVQKAYEASMAMIDDGVDVISNCANQGGTGVIKAGVERDIMLFGTSVDQFDLAPDNMVSGSMTDVTGLVSLAIDEVVSGNFKPGVHSLGWADGMFSLAPYHNFEDKIPQETKDKVEELKKQMIDGTLDVPMITTIQE